jgi:O-acetyl-ADP-ribose deacetylase (regulator of RNase III)
MIEFRTGNILESETEALVNTVNCVGVMGKGIALQFKQAFPVNFDKYARACRAGVVKPGSMFIVELGTLEAPQYIVNFPTKRDWRNKSRLSDIQEGLNALLSDVKRLNIRSIAIPPLGCGNGGLSWDDVRPLIVDTFSDLPDVHVIIYGPYGAPDPDEMPVAEKDIKMTRARALLIRLVEAYRSQGYKLSRIEIQKLAYFLQEAGEDLKLRYEKGLYGPYAHNLNHILQLMEGVYLRGYGDGSQRAEIYPLDVASAAARDFLAQDPSAQETLRRVQELIEGFETPYGMELLATVYWVTGEDEQAWQQVNAAITSVQGWNERKRLRYQPYHIQAAWQRLHDTDWITRKRPYFEQRTVG